MTMLPIESPRSTLAPISGLLTAALLITTGGCAPSTQSAMPIESAGAPTAQVALAPGKIRRTLIQKAPSGAPGWETRLYLVEYGPGAEGALHVHPALGMGYVFSGTFESAFGEEARQTVHEGQSFVDPAGIPHRFFRNPSSDHPLRFVIAYTIRSNDEQFYPGAVLPTGHTP